MNELFGSLKVGDSVDIVARNHNGTQSSHRSRIEDVNEAKGRLTIPAPTTAGSNTAISDAKSYELVIYKGGSKIVFDAVMYDKRKTGLSLYYEFEIQGAGRKIQNRSHFRVDVMLELKFAVIQRQKETPGGGADGETLTKPVNSSQLTAADYKKGTSRDLSGGGMQFTSAFGEAEAGDFVFIDLDLGNQHVLTNGKIIYREELPEARYLYRIKFVGISEREQDKLISYVLTQQRAVTVRASLKR